MRPLVASLALVVGLIGCGGDDERDTTATPPPAATSQAEPPASTTEPAPTEEERRAPAKLATTPKALAECLREQPGVEEVVVKARDSEDAVFFEDLVGGRVDVLGVTVDAIPGEVSIFLFASEADAAKAAPSAGGGQVTATPDGRAVVAVPSGARIEAVAGCLSATDYT